MRKKALERQFSVELNSADRIRLESLNEDKILIQGILGKNLKLRIVEGVFLDVKGCYGTLRVDIKKEELEGLLQQKGEVK
jgi:hypothetical protein